MTKILFSLAVCFLASTAWADDLLANLGGAVDTNNTLVTSNISYANKDLTLSRFSQYVDADYIYKSSKSSTSENLFELYAKVNYELDDGKNYLQTAGRYQYNELGTYTNMQVLGVGHGYRLIHTDRMKVSAETSVAQAVSDGLNQTVFRESMWASYKFNDKLSISEKYLIETGGVIMFQKNLLAVSYNISDNVTARISHTWIRDSVNNQLINLVVFGLGLKF